MFIARFSSLPWNEAEIAGAQCRAVAGACVDCVCAGAGFMAGTKSGPGTAAIT